MNILKSIGAVVGGFVAVFILSVVTDIILEKSGVFPGQNAAAYSQWMLALALVYRTVYAVVGGYVTAALAPTNPQRHVMVLAIIGTLAAVAGIFANLDKSTSFTLWYPIALAALSYPSVWLGGKLKINKQVGTLNN